jgi:hypothetical protein
MARKPSRTALIQGDPQIDRSLVLPNLVHCLHTWATRGSFWVLILSTFRLIEIYINDVRAYNYFTEKVAVSQDC